MLKLSRFSSTVRKSIQDLAAVQDVSKTLKKFDALQKNTTENANKHGGSSDWITPKYILAPLGKFDLDPCASVTQPWRTAKTMFTLKNNKKLEKRWFGRVWLNPPYSREVKDWMIHMAIHGNGIALVAARVDTGWFHTCVFAKADAILFLKGRITFYTPKGKKGAYPAGFPSCLVAYSGEDALVLKKAQKTLGGYFVGL